MTRGQVHVATCQIVFVEVADLVAFVSFEGMCPSFSLTDYLNLMARQLHIPLSCPMWISYCMLFDVHVAKTVQVQYM